MAKRVCEKCGKEFETANGMQRFCSRWCAGVKFVAQKKPLPYNTPHVRTDCVACVDKGNGYVCRGLVRLFCAEDGGKCVFYKRKKECPHPSAG